MIIEHLKLLPFICLSLLPLIAQADIYEYVDATGVSHYSDVPDHGGYVLILKTAPTQSSSVADSTAKKQTSKTTNRHARLPLSAQPELLAQIAQSAQNNQIQSELIRAVMHVESAFNTKAQSPKGAQGLMQLMPQTAKRYGVKDSYDSAQNIEGGAKYLKELLTLFNNDIRLTLAAYNAGENAVIKYGNKIPPYKETQAYVPKVLNVYNALLKRREISKQLM